ncbi:MAG: hypothetical protein WC943_13750 [Elusimicrobiota bacterium]
MRPLGPAALALLVSAAPCAVGQSVVRPVGQVSEVRLNVGPVAPALNSGAGSNSVGNIGPAMTFGGSVLSLRSGQIREAPTALPVSAVPALGASPVPGAAVAPAGQVPGLQIGQAHGAPALLQTQGGAAPSSPQASQARALDRENPGMGTGLPGKLSEESSEEGSGQGFAERAAAIGRHLRDSGKLPDQGSEFAEGFGRRLADLMLGSSEHRSGALDEGGPSGLQASGRIVGAGLTAHGSTAGGGAEDVSAERSVESWGTAPEASAEAVLPEGFPGVGRVLMEVSALTLRLSQVFPLGLQRLAAGASAGASRSLLDEIEVPSPAALAGRTESVGRDSAPGASDADSAYPGGFGSFMASVGGAMAAEGRSVLESGAFEPLETKTSLPVPLGAGAVEEEPAAPVHGSRGFSGDAGRLPAIPFSLLSYALLPLFLAGLELRSRV